ncbi:MAG TPA: hypothetical protein VMH81_24665 [Bryobacteraceae bacterium]|nr:hypothetical protein [Bryobacteraceae bacterium]
MAKAETLSTRVARLERLHEDIAQKHAELDAKVAILIDAQIQTQKQFQQTDEHIDKLVSAIGELIRNRNGG